MDITGIIQSIEGCKEGSQQITIRTNMGTLVLSHEQECCEHSEVDDINGDPADLIGKTVRTFQIKESEPESDVYWTFYEIQTEDADLTIKWLGDRNVGTGYYSVAVDAQWYPHTRPLKTGDILMHKDGTYIEVLKKRGQHNPTTGTYDWCCKRYDGEEEVTFSQMPDEHGVYGYYYTLIE